MALNSDEIMEMAFSNPNANKKDIENPKSR